MTGQVQRTERRKGSRMRSIEQIKVHLLESRNINPETGCWEWTGSCKSDGSGQMACTAITGTYRPALVRRIAAFLWLGLNINNSEAVVAPRCENPACFNPAHLQITTLADRQRSVALRHGRVLSTAKIKEVIELLRLKMPPKRIARLTKIPYQTVAGIKTLHCYKRECAMLGWTGDYEPAPRKLSNQDVIKIKELLAQGHTQASIAKIYNVHYSIICRIHKGKRIGFQAALQREAANVG